MCYAILRVKFQADKTAQVVEVESHRDLKKRVAEFCEKDQVVAVQVFVHEHDVVLTKEWRTQRYESSPEVAEAA